MKNNLLKYQIFVLCLGMFIALVSLTYCLIEDCSHHKSLTEWAKTEIDKLQAHLAKTTKNITNNGGKEGNRN